jgi:hypothetical protein
VRENEPGGGSLFFPVGSPDTASSSALQSRVSPLGSAVSIGSNSPASRNPTGGPIPSTPRHKRANGVVSSPISTVAAVIASAATAAAAAAAMPSSPIGSGKQTVQFSEVAEVAQRLQTKYGNQCASHPWGCVEISEDFHLELTIKMYMDWAGLVVSCRCLFFFIIAGFLFPHEQLEVMSYMKFIYHFSSKTGEPTVVHG